MTLHTSMETSRRSSNIFFEIRQCSTCNGVDPKDPIFLTCGHIFCGPPKDCFRKLGKLDSKTSTLKCPICNAMYKKAVSSSKPVPEQSDFCLAPNCVKHESVKVLFWCNDCDEKVCHVCEEETHEDHSMKSYKLHMQRSVKRKLTALTSVIDSRIAILDKSKRAMDAKRLKIISNFSDIKRFAESSSNKVDEKTLQAFLHLPTQRNENFCSPPVFDAEDFIFTDGHFRLFPMLSKVEEFHFECKISDIQKMKIEKGQKSDLVELRCGYKACVEAFRNKVSGINLFLLFEPKDLTIDWAIFVFFQFSIKNNNTSTWERKQLLANKYSTNLERWGDEQV